MKTKKITNNRLNYIILGQILLSFFIAVGIINTINYIGYMTTPSTMTLDLPDYFGSTNPINITYGDTFNIIVLSSKPDLVCISIFNGTNISADNNVLSCARTTFLQYNLLRVGINNKISYALPAGDYTLLVKDYDTLSSFRLPLQINKAVPRISCTFNGVGVDCVQIN